MREIRIALRSLAASPTVTGVAILSLALGTGANTAVFSLVNALLLRPLPVEEPDRLYALSFGAEPSRAWSFATWEAIRERSSLYDGAFAWAARRLNISDGAGQNQADTLLVSGGFFSTLGVRAAMGRTLNTDDDTPGGGSAGPAVVLSHGFWRRHFAGAVDVLGESIVIEQVPHTVVGVLPPRFFGVDVGRSFDLAVPLASESLMRSRDSLTRDRTAYWLRVLVRLRPDQTGETATSDMRASQAAIRAEALPAIPQAQQEFLRAPFTLVPAAQGTSTLRQRYATPLLVLLIIVGLVLLIACSNVANLLLARGSEGRHRASVHVAMGASRWQLMRTTLYESLILSGVGVALGLVFAAVMSRLLVSQLSTSASQVFLDLSFDASLWLFTTLVALGTAVIFGVGPALQVFRVSAIEVMKEQGPRSAGAARRRVNGAFVATQVAVSLVLVVAAGLFLRTFQALATMPMGFDTERVLVAPVDLARASVLPERRGEFFQKLVSDVALLPGVEHAAGSLITPLTLASWRMFVELPGTKSTAGSAEFQANFVTPGWFATYGLPLRTGRDFTAQDANGGMPVAIVSEMLVRRLFPERSPIGQAVAVAGGAKGELSLGEKIIVGVVGDAVYQNLRDPINPSIYFPINQWDLPAPLQATLNISVRSASARPAQLTPSVVATLRGVDPQLTTTSRTLEERVDDALVQERLMATLASTFAVVALVLASLGLYGITRQTVARWRAEIAVRLAIGATPRMVVGMIMSRVMAWVMLGAAVGAGVSLWLATFTSSLVFGVAPRDPWTVGLAVAVLSVVGFLGGIVPALRASRANPTDSLREV